MTKDILDQFSAALQEEFRLRFESMREYAIDEAEELPVWSEETIYLITQDMESSDVFTDFQKEIMDWWISKGVYRYVEAGESVEKVPERNKTGVWPYFRGRRVEFVKHL